MTMAALRRQSFAWLGLACVVWLSPPAHAQVPRSGKIHIGSSSRPVRINGALEVNGALRAYGAVEFQSTQASTTYYVASTGNDYADCTTESAQCLTVDGTLNKIPKALRHETKVKLAAGSFGGLHVSGFAEDVGLQQTTAGLLIEGTLADITPATGSATGTATAVVTGDVDTNGTLTDSEQTWTTDDLQGHFLVITAGTGAGQVKPIVSNTATE